MSYLLLSILCSCLVSVISFSYIVERSPSGVVIYRIDCIQYHTIKYGTDPLSNVFNFLKIGKAIALTFWDV